MYVSINPSYYCNFRCSFCYLTKEQLSDKKQINLIDLQGLLYEIKAYKPDEEIIFDLYGGEISALQDSYVISLLDSLSLHTRSPIRITTNLSRIPEYFYRDDVRIAVSYDYKARQDWQTVLENMKILNQERWVDILMLASKNLVRYSASEIMQSLRSIPWINSIEIKPYSTNQANQDKVSFNEFEDFVKDFIRNKNRELPRLVELSNESMIESVINYENNSFSDDHIYITPNGKFAVLEFDKNDNEYFMELEGFQDYLNWTTIEKNRVSMNSYCMSCEYYGRCLSEHLREVKDISKSCNGFKHLIDWYKNEFF